MKKRALTVAVAWFVVVVASYVWQAMGHPHPLLTNLLFLVAPALAVASGLYTLNTYKLPTGGGRVMVYLTSGLTCWFMGELLFFLFQFVSHTDPFPSMADVFYIIAYPLILIGLVQEVRTHGFSWRKLNKMTVLTGAMLALALGFIVSYFGIFLAYKAGEPLLNNVVAMGYGVADLVLLVPIFFMLKIATDFRGGKLFYSWMMLFVALLFIMLGDVLFAIFTDQYADLNPQAALIDLTWTTGYLLFAYGLFYKSATIVELRSTLLKKHALKHNK